MKPWQRRICEILGPNWNRPEGDDKLEELNVFDFESMSPREQLLNISINHSTHELELNTLRKFTRKQVFEILRLAIHMVESDNWDGSESVAEDRSMH